MNFKPDEYQQAYLDYKLVLKSITRLLASAGSGKTTTIASKIAMLLEEGVPETDILAITFTNKSSYELRNIIKRKSGKSIKYCSTFHGFSITMLKENNVKPVVMNEWQALLLIRKIMETLGMSSGIKKQDTTIANDFLNKFNTMRVLDYNLNPFTFPLMEHFNDLTVNTDQFISLYVEYDTQKKNKNLWDFQDLISPRAEAATKVKPNLKLIFIDETQDSDLSQYTWVFNQFPDAAYTLVGDTKQCLYAFRLAYPEPMDSNSFFEPYGEYVYKNFPLINNYRSTANIVRLFNATAKKYQDHLPSIAFHPESAGSVKIVKFEENTQEGHHIAKRIRELISEGVNPSDITVLARRSSYLKQIVEPSLVEQNIPYILSTPQHKIKFFELPLNDLYFSMLHYLVTDDLSKMAKASLHLRGIGKTTQERIINEVMDTQATTNQLFMNHLNVIDENFVDISGLAEISQLVLRLIPIISKEDTWTEKKLQSIHKTFVSYIKHIQYEGATFDDAETAIQMVLDSIYEYQADTSEAVTLTTIHSYKGLENDYVFVGDLTYIGTMDIDVSTFPTVYVALSRARKHITVVHSEKTFDRRFGKIKSKLHPAMHYTMRQLGVI